MIGATMFAAEGTPDSAGSRPVDESRLRTIIDTHADFIWRSLRRLGLPADAAEDAAQRVFLVASERLAEIRPGAEQAFLFKTAVHIAARTRRAFVRRREDLVEDAAAEVVDPAPGADELLDRGHARALLAQALERMDIETRAVFILFELEGTSTAEIAEMLEVPRGTVASRLRRSREDFEAFIKRFQARENGRNPR
jgi:RNA polymerase sigma-70 factor, ECF subfamily